MQFLELVDLAAVRLGGQALEANDEFFGGKENLLKSAPPVFAEGKYTDRGRWMDGWETRRRRAPGFDWCQVKLGLAGVVRGIVVDTSFFTTDHPEQCSLDGSPDGAVWTTLLPQTPLQGDFLNLFPVDDPHRYAFVRLNIYPDGGVARLRVHGEVIPDFSRVADFVDLAGVVNGGVVVNASDMFAGYRHNLLLPGPSLHPGDGWETKRRRGPGHDWVSVRLGARGRIRAIEIDTSHCQGNCPESCSLDAGEPWETILPKAKLQPDASNVFQNELMETGPVSRVRLSIYPDGGIARLRVWGTLA